MSDVAEMWEVEGHPQLLLRIKLRRMVLTVRMRHRKAARNEFVAVTMTPRYYGHYNSVLVYEGIACDRSGKSAFVKLSPRKGKMLFELDTAGFFEESKAWEPVTATAYDASQWWRVLRPFTAWSRQAMKQEANLLDCMPCELCWLSTKAQLFFLAVYIVLAALPRDLVDAYVLPHLSSDDIIQ